MTRFRYHPHFISCLGGHGGVFILPHESRLDGLMGVLVREVLREAAPPTRGPQEFDRPWVKDTSRPDAAPDPVRGDHGQVEGLHAHDDSIRLVQGFPPCQDAVQGARIIMGQTRYDSSPTCS